MNIYWFLESKKPWRITILDVSKETLHVATFWVNHVTSSTDIPVDGTMVNTSMHNARLARSSVLIVPNII